MKKIKNFILNRYFILSFSFLLYIAIHYLYSYSPTITIAVGQKNGAYAQYAKAYKRILKKYNIDLNIVYTKGSSAGQQLLLDDKVDISIAQTGTEKKGLKVLANIAYEPVWLFYKSKKISKLKDLRDKRVNFCDKKSGTFPIATEIITLLGSHHIIPSYLSTREAFEKLKNGEIDAIFYVVGIKSLLLQEMLKTEGIKVLNFSNSLAYQQYFLQQGDSLDKNYFKPLTLHKNAIDINKKIPYKRVNLLAKRTILVTTNKMSNAMARLFLKVATEVHSSIAIFQKENHFPNDNIFNLPQHYASKIYFEEKNHRYEKNNLLKNIFSFFHINQSYKFWIDQALKDLEDFILLFISFIVLFGFYIEVAYPWWIRMKRKKINDWYEKINKIDTNINSFGLEELKEKKAQLKRLLIEIQNSDHINPVHLEAYYALQNQIHNMIEEFTQKIIKMQGFDTLPSRYFYRDSLDKS